MGVEQPVSVKDVYQGLLFHERMGLSVNHGLAGLHADDAVKVCRCPVEIVGNDDQADILLTGDFG